MTAAAPLKNLNELQVTVICGNDISSSCLYVSALTILYAGQFAWISLLVVALVLFFFRRIYREVVGGMPLNGGAYNALLNTASKQMASVAASLTILSYMATAVISANEAMHYLHNMVNEALRKDLEVLDRTYPDVQIEYLELEGIFSPELIEQLSLQ